MKSLRNLGNGQDTFILDHQFFTEPVKKHILNEGFEVAKNDSYSERREAAGERCYKLYAGNSGSGGYIYVYICNDGIEVDHDASYGGNLSNHFVLFESYNDFEEVYSHMVELVTEISKQ